MSNPSFAELDQLATDELRERAFALARERRDLRFFWSVLRRLPYAVDSEVANADLGEVGVQIEEAVGLWRELTGQHGYGDAEPLLRAAFIDYLLPPAGSAEPSA